MSHCVHDSGSHFRNKIRFLETEPSRPLQKFDYLSIDGTAGLHREKTEKTARSSPYVLCDPIRSDPSSDPYPITYAPHALSLSLSFFRPTGEQQWESAGGRARKIALFARSGRRKIRFNGLASAKKDKEKEEYIHRGDTCIRSSLTIYSFFMFQSEHIQIFPITVASTFVTLSWNSSSALSTGRGYILQVRIIARFR